jgi:hypothetical protein
MLENMSNNNGVPAPVQSDLTVDRYFKLIETYAVALGVDLENKDIKVKFIRGLLPENKIRAIRFGIKRPTKEIVEHLKAITTGLTTDIQKYRLGRFDQGNDSVMEYFRKLIECSESVNYGDEYLRSLFLRGLTRDNQIEARICGLELPLEELVEKLSMIEDIRKNK